MNRNRPDYLIVILLIILVGVTACQNNQEKEERAFKLFMDEFAEYYPTQVSSNLALHYLDNLNKIHPKDSIGEQIVFFQSFQDRLASINYDDLNTNYQSDYKTLEFEMAIHLERLRLEANFIDQNHHTSLNERGIYFNLNGKNWYRFFVKKRLGAAVTIDEIEDISSAEIKRTQLGIQQIQATLGFSKDSIGFYEHLSKKGFFEIKSNLLQDQFNERQETVWQNIWNQFYQWDLPFEKIDQGIGNELNELPGYYEDASQTFYFNLGNEPFNVRQIDWIYLHEATPGHHLQITLEKQLKDSLPTYRAQIPFDGYREGWSVYAEDLGGELGCYGTAYTVLGKYEEDLMRAVRMQLDVSINFRGWSDDKARNFWKKNIKNQRNIGDQDDFINHEIERIKKWPAQSMVKVYGAFQLKKMKKAAEKKAGRDFNIKDFHNKVLNYGPMHWEGLRTRVLED